MYNIRYTSFKIKGHYIMISWKRLWLALLINNVLDYFFLSCYSIYTDNIPLKYTSEKVE